MPSRSASVAVALGLGYLFGTLPSADVASRMAGGPDLRTSGSGNPGGANAAKVLGKRWGYSVMAADIAKGAVASAAGRRVAGDVGAHVAATAAVAGHCYPVWTGFRGGKGVATSVGQCLATFPAYTPIDLAVAALTAANPRWKQRAFTATMTASVCWVGGAVVWWRRRLPNAWGPQPTVALPIAAVVSSAIITERFLAANRIARHRAISA